MLAELRVAVVAGQWGFTTGRIPSLMGEIPEQAAACDSDPLSSSLILAIVSPELRHFGAEVNLISDDGLNG